MVMSLMCCIKSPPSPATQITVVTPNPTGSSFPLSSTPMVAGCPDLPPSLKAPTCSPDTNTDRLSPMPLPLRNKKQPLDGMVIVWPLEVWVKSKRMLLKAHNVIHSPNNDKSIQVQVVPSPPS